MHIETLSSPTSHFLYDPLLFNDDSHHSLSSFIRCFFTFASHSHKPIISKAPDISNNVEGLISNVVTYYCLFVQQLSTNALYRDKQPSANVDFRALLLKLQDVPFLDSPTHHDVGEAGE